MDFEEKDRDEESEIISSLREGELYEDRTFAANDSALYNVRRMPDGSRDGSRSGSLVLQSPWRQRASALQATPSGHTLCVLPRRVHCRATLAVSAHLTPPPVHLLARCVTAHHHAQLQNLSVIPEYADVEPRISKGPHPWLRPNEFAKDPELFKGGVEAGDVVQGQLGDCWILGALAAVAAHPDDVSDVLGLKVNRALQLRIMP